MENKNACRISDDALESVSGGVQAPVTGRGYVTTCDDFVCVWCGRKKATPTEKSHVCAAQSGMGRTPSEWIEAVFENNCDSCEHLYSCSRANTYYGLGSPTPPNG